MNPSAIMHHASRPSRLLKFICDTHPPASYIVLTGLWSWSLMTMLQRGAGDVQFSGGMLVVSASFFLILLFLRAIDEIKDLDYDRVHHPDRPLVCGDVSVAEVWSLAAAVALLIVVLNIVLDPLLALFTAADMGYGLGLLALERYSRRFRQSILLNLVVTFPVSAALNVYAYLYLSGRGQAPDIAAAAPMIAAHIAAFLHFEFGRKLKWPHFSAAGENGYAMVLGTGKTILVCAALGMTACGLSTWIHLQDGADLLAWLPWVALIPSVLGIANFLENKSTHLELKPYFVGFLLLFFVTNIAAALLTDTHQELLCRTQPLSQFHCWFMR